MGRGEGGWGCYATSSAFWWGECVLSLGISRRENIVPDNQEIVSARRQDNANFLLLAKASSTNSVMLHNGGP